MQSHFTCCTLRFTFLQAETKWDTPKRNRTMTTKRHTHIVFIRRSKGQLLIPNWGITQSETIWYTNEFNFYFHTNITNKNNILFVFLFPDPVTYTVCSYTHSSYYVQYLDFNKGDIFAWNISHSWICWKHKQHIWERYIREGFTETISNISLNTQVTATSVEFLEESTFSITEQNENIT